jgi:hypothetical protein
MAKMAQGSVAIHPALNHSHATTKHSDISSVVTTSQGSSAQPVPNPPPDSPQSTPLRASSVQHLSRATNQDDIIEGKLGN